MKHSIMETSINERINSQLYSDVINSYPDINAITSTRNIEPGSYKEAVDQCLDQTIATMNSVGGQTLFTRLRLTPTTKNATLAQLAKIYFQFYFPENALALLVAKQENPLTQNSKEPHQTNKTDFSSAPREHVRFKLFYDQGFSIASMVDLCLGADIKISTGNFNYQQSFLTLNSLPDYITENSTSESTLKALVANDSFAGVGSGLVDVAYPASASGVSINQKICIEGLIDLDRGNPMFHNFPIITRNMSEIYIRLYMENFLRELKIVYLNKSRVASVISGSLSGASIANGTAITLVTNNGSGHALVTTEGGTNAFTTSGATSITGSIAINNSSMGPVEILPYQALPADKADYIYLDGVLCKVRLIVNNNSDFTAANQPFISATRPLIRNFTGIHWTRFEIRRFEFDIEDYEDIKASQARAGVYKFPVHIWKSKNFDQTNMASNSSNALQTVLNCPNIDRMFITMPLTRDYNTFCPTLAATDMNPQINNSPVLPRTEDNLNTRTIERIGSVFVDTDKYSMPSDLFNSLNIPTWNKHLWEKSAGTYGGAAAFSELQRSTTITSANPATQINQSPIFIPNKYAYALELNEGGCFRRGVNSVLRAQYLPNLPLNLQQSTTTSDDVYYKKELSVDSGGNNINEDVLVQNNYNWAGNVQYGDFRASGAVSSVHCLCDYIFKMEFDQFGLLTNFGISPYDDQ